MQNITRQFPLMLAAGFLRPASLESWHMEVPPLLEMWSSSMAVREAREQLRAPANDARIPGDTCRGWGEGGRGEACEQVSW